MSSIGPVINYNGIPSVILRENGFNDYSVLVAFEIKRLFHCSLGWGEIMETDKRVFWICNGVYHREDGPAAIYPNGTLEWYENGVLHRANGLPAVIETETDLYYWYFKGNLHRTDGPAYEMPGYKEWWIEGECIKATE